LNIEAFQIHAFCLCSHFRYLASPEGSSDDDVRKKQNIYRIIRLFLEILSRLEIFSDNKSSLPLSFFHVTDETAFGPLHTFQPLPLQGYQ